MDSKEIKKLLKELKALKKAIAEYKSLFQDMSAEERREYLEFRRNEIKALKRISENRSERRWIA